jgi:hypothetical protein
MGANMDQAYFLQYFHYDPKTGQLTWAVSRSNQIQAGTPINTISTSGYIVVQLLGKFLYCHRIAMIMAGIDLKPTDCVDHINGVRTDNRIVNLRIATNSQNAQNSKLRKHNQSGLKGAKLLQNGRYGSRIILNKKEYWLGTYATAQEAHEVYKKASMRMHGDFGRFE